MRPDISIHPPREGWDELGTVVCGNGFISIHPPREGWDRYRFMSPMFPPIFQSTHPVRGGTYAPYADITQYCISIHPPREGWDIKAQGRPADRDISIHPPREGWDWKICQPRPG